MILLARSLEKVKPVIEQINQIDSNIKAYFVPIELDKLSSVTSAAEEIKANPSIKQIDLMINNAGIMGTPYRKNDAGIESQFATNHIGHFYLTMYLQSLIASASKGARIVNLSSDGYKISGFRFDDYNFSDGSTYDPWTAYGQSKTANILFTRQLARKLASHNVQSFSVHPGVIFDTSLGNHLDHSEFGDIPAIAEKNTGETFEMGQPKSSQQGVSTTLVAALDPDISGDSGSYLTDCHVEPLRDYASSDENAEELWQLSEKLAGKSWNLDDWK